MAPKPKKAKPRKAKPKVHEFDLTLVGMKWRLSDQEILQLEELIEDEGGVPCKFEREPTNEVDPKAIKVFTLDPERKVFHNVQVGYVRRPANGPLFDLLRRGASVKMCLLVYVNPKDGSGELQVGITRPVS